ncbi:hypothetical protein A3C23_05555 [Candidatus Roizmanbacteria bacterium RIFCSPHIGHO2_02_FULL_37_13b]|uniref:Bacterial spore germination immunoglobulin-like domain-containing protein n=1 Tax=Candidatus Roizmanbacteria bacterium RIFCSPLOWO2_02_FULL_36_11 TaxID=1802071 RepID=A0A1F7JCF2_9BACT|nr:MAG: hypothetical protein A3C23_05555 [Candidatus Roizmanbacteria bacterium RIFCSPHIGHO2_02_FULL_37_13b]OGK53293.1 MAG: hypothetical protein A3H78_03235 [Candidatus Roizmanbacteria bacterium RIFCSPLOWO2_02_FULL_36_11]
MKKETIVAVILGIAFGAIVATSLVVFTKNRSLQQKKVLIPTPIKTIVVQKEEATGFKIIEPENQAQVATDSVNIKGETAVNSVIIIQSPLDEKVFKSKEKLFDIKFPLSLGENIINITSYFQNIPTTKTINIYQIKEQI